MIRKILIANRGEIVNRIIRACEKLGIIPVLIYSQADKGLDYLETPVEKYLLKGSTLASTYLSRDQVISIAKSCGADAIHPGYGFLSENAAFATQCNENQITWIGPSPAVMQKMSGKESSRKQAILAGVPVLDAVTGTPDELFQLAGQFTYPLLVKAVSGGGGRGMRIIREPSQFKNQVEMASREAGLSFGDPGVFIEQYLEKAKHIEVQVIGDKQGNIVHLFERECTIQRRYQKLIEESPSPSLSDQQRAIILEDAVNLARSAGYDSAGTLEFLLASNGKHYFMEMNTRIQVEHTVTEMVTGIDLVAEQISVASGNPLSFKQEDITTRGHSIECRICAEDPASGFNPGPGEISLFIAPAEEGIRIDHAIGSRFEVSPVFDSLVAKLIIHDTDREAALQKMHHALGQLVIHGVATTREYLRKVINHQNFINSEFYTDFVQNHTSDIISALKKEKNHPPAAVYAAALKILTSGTHSGSLPDLAPSPWSTIGYWRILPGKLLEYEGNKLRVEPVRLNEKLNGRINCSMSQDGTAWVSLDGTTYKITEPARTRNAGNREETGDNEKINGTNVKNGKNSEESDRNVCAPLPGVLSRLLVKEGDWVHKGDLVAVIESMKTENQILADGRGRIGTIIASEGQQLRLNELIFKIVNN